MVRSRNSQILSKRFAPKVAQITHKKTIINLMERLIWELRIL
nr:MAG TPA: hypothetical protein [Caudoviricetes sp.]